MKTPPASVLLKKAAGLATGKKPGSGSKEPNKNKVGKVTAKQVRELAAQKMRRHELHRHRGGDADRPRAPRARWASRSSTERAHGTTGRGDASSGHVRWRGSRSTASRTTRVEHGGRPNEAERRRMPKLRRIARRSSKRSTSARKYTIEEACALVKKAKFAKFDETVDLAVRLGVNPKHADQMVRGALVLPHGTGQDRARRSSSPRARRSARRVRPAPTSPAATTWSRRSPKDSWTSIA